MRSVGQRSHIEIALRGGAACNAWRRQHPSARLDLSEAHLAGADLAGADLSGADLTGADLTNANLTCARLCGRSSNRTVTLNPDLLTGLDLGSMSVTWADLAGAQAGGADLSGADLSGANLQSASLPGARAQGANFTWANLAKVVAPNIVLTGATLFESYLIGAHLDSALLVNAELRGAKLEGTILRAAELSGANLSRASLIDADLTDSVLDGAIVHGTSAWNVRGVPASQRNLVITRPYPPYNEPLLTCDDLEVAQFIYLLLNNHRIRNVIETITSKAVLILGRFTPSRKAVLEALRDALRDRGYVPLLFDFTPAPERDLTETVVLLASLSRFVIADLSDARSIPQELSSIVPLFASLPIQPIIEQGNEAYAMFEHWQTYPWVLPAFSYRDARDLLTRLDSYVIEPAEHRRVADDELQLARSENARLKQELARYTSKP
jgi:uncharacterized protein YjbI with pentapeptide repeats